MTTADCYHGCDYTEAALLAPVDHSWLDAGLQPEALRDVINQVIAAVEADTGAAPTMKQMGAVMKQAQQLVAGRADGKRVSTAVRELLQ